MKRILLCLLLTGCQSCPTVVPAERVVTQEVDKPILVAREPPPAVTGCWAALPPVPAFKDAPGGLLLPTDQIDVFLKAEAAQRRCDDAWRTWATTP